jgi:hypothetical protein
VTVTARPGTLAQRMHAEADLRIDFADGIDEVVA